MIYFPQIRHLDISGCTNIDATLFVDCIPQCKDLIQIEMVGCKQFSSSQMVRIMSNLPKLEWVDCTMASQIHFCDTYTIVCALICLRAINVEPNLSFSPIPDWHKLVSTFLSVQFGHSIMALLPDYGNNFRYSCNDTDCEQ